MRLRNIVLAGIILLALAFTSGTGMADTDGTADQANVTENNTDGTASNNNTVFIDDIVPDEGLIGPGNALYGLKIAFGKLGTTFTFDPKEKLGRQVSQARHRIAEAKAELRKKNTKAAETALEEYRAEMNDAERTISAISANDPGLVNIQLTIVKHKYVLEGLLNQTPNSTGLQRAYNNSLNLERKFAEKTKQRFVRKMSREGHEVLEQELEDSEEDGRTQVKAEITDNGSIVKIKVRFVTNSTNRTDIAADTLKELQNIRNNLSDSLKLEQDDADTTVDVMGTPTSTMTVAAKEESAEDYRVKLEIKAKVEDGVTEVKAEYKFHLDAEDRDGIIKGIDKKLSELDLNTVLDALDAKIREEHREIGKSTKEDKTEKEHNGRKGDSEKED